jgi:UDP-3-O-[3-hydroxymyristoyl] N-acetylglucosamine deacetylase
MRPNSSLARNGGRQNFCQIGTDLMTIDLLACQTTIGRPIVLSGIGVHSGSDVSLTFLPADVNTGIVFNRIHPDGECVELRAVSAQVGSTDFCTVLGTAASRSVATIEHLMAALSGLCIDNVLIEVHGAEVPIMDGSSAAFVDAFDQAGLVRQDAKRRYIRVTRPVRVEMGGSWAEFVPHEATRFEIDIDFDCKLIGRQAWKGDLTPETFRSELARARTFGFMRDVERLWASGHALGSSLDNSLVIGDDDRVINAEGLRYADEFARHKALDAVGDLSLAGARFIGCYRSYRGGHKLNAVALKALLDDRSAYDVVEARPARRKAAGADLIAVNAPAFAPWAL